MFDISSWELLVVSLVALIVVGPQRLPRLVRTLGLWAGKLRSTCIDFNRQIQREALAGEVQQLRQRLEQASRDTERNLLDAVDIDRDYRQPRAVAAPSPSKPDVEPQDARLEDTTPTRDDAPTPTGVEMKQEAFHSGSTCRTPILTRVTPRRATANGVTYVSEGLLALISDRADTLLTLVDDFTWGTIIAMAPGLDPSQVPQGWTVIDAETTSIEGWLGNFRLESVMTQTQATRSVTADIIIDLSARPVLERSVFPPGYLHADASIMPSALAAQADGLVGTFEKPRYFAYTPEICAHEISGQTGCTRCLDVCGADAIRSEGALIRVEPHLCQGCSACTLACPTGALSVARPRRLDLMDQLNTVIDALDTPPSTLHVVAQGAPTDTNASESLDSSATLEVPVIAAFGEELWLAALARGIQCVVLWPEAGMPTDTRQLLDKRLAEVACITEAMGRGRSAIRLGGDRRHAVPDIATFQAVSREPLAASQESRKRELLNTAMRLWQESLSPGNQETFELPVGSPIGGISVDPEACVMCSVCARSCPTASIRYGENDQTARLEFAEANCIQCGLCERLCPEDAITLQPRLRPAEQRYRWEPLNEAPLATCDACRRPHMPEPLLVSMIGKLPATSGAADIERQFRRCPACRHGQ